MLENNHFRFFRECGERKFLLVRSQESYVGLSFCPLVDTPKQLRFVWTRFEVVVSVMHGNQDRWGKLAADGRDLIRFEDVELCIDRNHEHIHAAKLSEG